MATPAQTNAVRANPPLRLLEISWSADPEAERAATHLPPRKLPIDARRRTTAWSRIPAGERVMAPTG
jgi:hypothetical protein